MKIVQFKDDTFAIRKFNWTKFRYEYKDISSFNTYWWPMKDVTNFNLGCKSADKERVQMYFYGITDKGK